MAQRELIDWKCPNCWTVYHVDKRYGPALKDKKDCKFCVRKDPNIPTTAEMDGLLTQEDMRNRNQVVRQCMNCSRWTQMTHEGIDSQAAPCTAIVNGKPYVDGRGKTIEGCGQISYDHDSMKSLRSYRPDVDNKRRPGVKSRKEK